MPGSGSVVESEHADFPGGRLYWKASTLCYQTSMMTNLLSVSLPQKLFSESQDVHFPRCGVGGQVGPCKPPLLMAQYLYLRV